MTVITPQDPRPAGMTLSDCLTRMTYTLSDAAPAPVRVPQVCALAGVAA